MRATPREFRAAATSRSRSDGECAQGLIDVRETHDEAHGPSGLDCDAGAAGRGLRARSCPSRPQCRGLIEEGLASWDGAQLAGHLTANGERFDPAAMTAAHRTLAFNTCVRVKVVLTGRVTEVRINDRGPFVAGRIIDLSEAAARALGTQSQAQAPAAVQPLGPPAQPCVNL